MGTDKIDASNTHHTRNEQTQPSKKWCRWPSYKCLNITFTGIVAVFTIVLAAVSTCQWGVMERQWETMEKQLRASNRPWIEPHITVVKPLTFYGNYAEVVLTITVRNGGTSPAIRTFPVLSLVINGVSTDDNPILKMQNILCSPQAVKARLGASKPTSSGNFRMVLPNSEDTYPTWGVQSGKSDWSLSSEGEAFAWVTGCIDYVDEFGDGHATLFTLLLATSAFKPSGVINGPWGLAPYGQGAY